MKHNKKLEHFVDPVCGMLDVNPSQEQVRDMCDFVSHSDLTCEELDTLVDMVNKQRKEDRKFNHTCAWLGV